MVRLSTQQDFRPLQNLDFCYLCGRPFEPQQQKTRDHLPPSSLFLPEDRDVALILPTHADCNTNQHASDEVIGELIADVQGWPDKRGQRPIDGAAITIGERAWGLSKLANINRFIRRCVVGFHAALYRQSLPTDTPNAFHPPMRGGELDPSASRPKDAVQAGLLADKLLGQHAYLVRILKRSRCANSTDRVICRNGRCVYECVWDRIDRRTACVFGLKIYDWQRIGEQAGYQARGCVGIYWPPHGKPPEGVNATALEFPFPNRESLDPFGD